MNDCRSELDELRNQIEFPDLAFKLHVPSLPSAYTRYEGSGRIGGAATAQYRSASQRSTVVSCSQTAAPDARPEHLRRGPGPTPACTAETLPKCSRSVRFRFSPMPCELIELARQRHAGFASRGAT